MRALFSLIAVLALVLVAYVGVEFAGLASLFGVVIPYLALAIFIGGFIYRILKWVKSPVPFRIPTTAGQQKSLPWIKQNKIDNPSTKFGVFLRMLLEVLFFRSLLRNTRTELIEDDGKTKMGFASSKWLWAFALIFHYSFLIIAIRHLRLFLDPVPGFVSILDSVDSMFKIGLPSLYITDALFLVAVAFLFLRRVFIPQVKYISQIADYFPLFLIGGIGVTGVLMRYFTRVDVAGVKELVMGLVSFNPVVTDGIHFLAYAHIFLVSCLFIYFPTSKLMHAGGVFLSPTRNMVNNNRMVRHINPWNYPVKVHTYAEYEEDFREKMISVGIPVEKE